MPKNPMRDVIVLLPGITGSVLQKDGRDVWAVSPGGVLNFIKSLGKSIESLELVGDDPDLDDAPDGVVATRLMPDIHLIPGLWSIDGYGKVRASILEHFAVTEGENYFEFPYDWRRTNRASARNLEKMAEPALRAWRESSGNADAKLILIGHSMGGLVSRWFLEKLGGWELTRSLITFGTPYRGSVNAVESLYAGVKKKIGPFKVFDLTAALRSFTSLYELLPIYPCVDVGEADLLRVAETDLPHIDRELAREALRFHHDIRDAVAAHDDQDDVYGVRPISGIEQPTRQSVRLIGDTLEFLRSWKGRDMSGDGTVPRVSALPLEIEDPETGMFAGEKHGALQNNGSVLTHLRGLLTGQDIDLSSFEVPAPAWIGVDVEELVGVDEPVSIVARGGGDGLRLKAYLSNVDTGEIAGTFELRSADDGTYRVEVPPLAEGSYRLQVGGHGVHPVTSLLTVLA